MTPEPQQSTHHSNGQGGLDAHIEGLCKVAGIDYEPMPTPVALPPADFALDTDGTAALGSIPLTPSAAAHAYSLRLARAGLLNARDQIHVAISELARAVTLAPNADFATATLERVTTLHQDVATAHVELASILEALDMRGVR